MNEANRLTRVIVFDVKPRHQAELATLLADAIETHVGARDGFYGARILGSEDGRRVINIAEWESEAAWLAMEADAATGAAVTPAFRLAESTDLRTFRLVRAVTRRSRQR